MESQEVSETRSKLIWFTSNVELILVDDDIWIIPTINRAGRPFLPLNPFLDIENINMEEIISVDVSSNK